MIRSRHPLRLVSVVVALVTLVGAGAFGLTMTVGGSTHDIALEGVDGDELAEFNVRILEPKGEPSVTASNAEEAAKDSVRDGAVRQTALVRVVRDTMIPPMDRLAWAVSFDPVTVDPIAESGPHSPERQKAREVQTCSGPPRYRLTFIDAVNGGLLFSVQAAGPEVDCPDLSD